MEKVILALFLLKNDMMKFNISEDPATLGRKAGIAAAELIRLTIAKKGSANIILATGTSQFETLNQLIGERDIDWKKIKVFHLDEYIGLSMNHPGSFRKYLKERVIDKVDPGRFFPINGEADPEEECERLGKIILENPIDVALVGIGENGHLAFNDPPADFQTDRPYIIVDLDEPCRNQQYKEGWFESLEKVPRQAISMSVKQILKSKHILCSVPEKRKAQAVRGCFEKEISNLYPASILQEHPQCTVYLDSGSSSLLRHKENSLK